MDSVKFDSVNNVNYVPAVENVKPAVQTSAVAQTNNATTTPSYYNTSIPAELSDSSQRAQLNLRTSLTTKDEKKKYNELYENLDSKYRKKLEFALKTGTLLKNDSNDKSSVLDNLHKIITEERDPGLDKYTILEECLDIISNPYVITQTAEDIPDEYKKQVVGIITSMDENPDKIKETVFNLNNLHTGTCPAASIEFDLATKKPAEFFRMVEGLTSPNNAVVKNIQLNSLSDKSLDAIWLLTNFKTPHRMNGFDNADILLKPDENAIIRARIQNNHRDNGERSIIDVLMQSTFMQLGSQQTYNSLTDKRKPNTWTQEDGGLIDFEKTYVESIVEDKNTTSVTYQKVDENGKLVGYEKDYDTIKKELLDTLNMGHNIIIGYTWEDPDNDYKLAGHEITIVGHKQNEKGEGVFICQDSDDNLSTPIEMPEKFLLQHIHHAGLPDEIASRDFDYKDSWEVGVEEFKNLQK